MKLSTSLVVAQPQISKRTYRTNWKNRGTYGLILKKKLEYLMDLFIVQASLPSATFDIDTIINLSRSIDFNISIQLSNIRAVEEIKALKDLEKWKNELISKLGNQGSQTSVSVTWKY